MDKAQLESLIQREAEKHSDSEGNNGNAVISYTAGAYLLLPALIEALEALERMDKELTCPAAEYVPVMRECFKIKDEALQRIKELLGGGK